MMQYLTAQVEEMRPGDYASLMVVKAVKGRDTGGRRTALKYGGAVYSFGPGNPGPAVDLWLAWARDQLQHHYPDGAVTLVPVPNSDAVAGGVADFATAALARRLAALVGDRVNVQTQLWWDEPMQKASEGGPRFAQQVFPHLVAQEHSGDAPRVLLDDVLTSGGHLRAAAAKLRELGHDPELAICCGRTVHEQLENPYRVPVEELPDFDPDDPFGFRDLFVPQ